MRRRNWAHWMLRPAGACLLVAVYGIAMHLAAIGRGHAGHEPAIVYLWAVIAFGCGSTGAATLVHGAHLFDRITVSERWISRARPAMRQPEWQAGPDRSPERARQKALQDEMAIRLGAHQSGDGMRSA